MSSSTPNNDTAQQRWERLLLAQAERQRARELEIARQEAEFAAEMERLEEEAAKEEEERRLAEERRVEEEKRIKKEQRLAEEKRAAEEQRIAEEKLAEEQALAEEMRLEEERKAELRRFEEELVLEEKQVAELKAREDKRAADAAEDAEEEREQNAAYVKLVEENRKEREKAVKELERRQKRAPAAKPQTVDVVVPSRPSGSQSKVFKSKSVISDDSDVMDVDKEQVEALRGVKRKRPIKMIAKGMNFSEPNGEVEPVPEQVVQPPSESSQPHPACSRCILIGRPSKCRPQSTGRQAQACAVCHQQRQRCSWSGDNAARRSWDKRVKVDEDDYEGPAKRAGERLSVR
ncbi:hypothetical protein DFJ43DRAFT_1149836 [Lentinula guzmanii]|uniref:Uncharacterized protein n=1 Tax=Lentinula guzmanii TaxID=2804957 RepID=A0AA38JRA5_9AGAR|nr:hypothetical protein DFJ43DRAFT_1149836 [Lentinula guzmanii]